MCRQCALEQQQGLWCTWSLYMSLLKPLKFCVYQYQISLTHSVYPCCTTLHDQQPGLEAEITDHYVGMTEEAGVFLPEFYLSVKNCEVSWRTP